MAGVTIDLGSLKQDIIAEGSQVIDQAVGPWIAEELRRVWPRDTGRSGDAWTYSGGSLQNDTSYVTFTKTSGGLAIDTVLPEVQQQAARLKWG